MRPTPSSGPSWSGDGVAPSRVVGAPSRPPLRMAPRSGHASQGLQPVSQPPRSTDGSFGPLLVLWPGIARVLGISPPPAHGSERLSQGPSVGAQPEATTSAMRAHRPAMARICNSASAADDAYVKASPPCNRQRSAYLPTNPSPIRLMHQRIWPLASAARQPGVASTMRSTNSATARLPLGTLCREQQLTE